MTAQPEYDVEALLAHIVELEAIVDARSNLPAVRGDGVTIRVIGEPSPQGSKKAFATKDKIVMVEMSKSLPDWRQSVSGAALQARSKLTGDRKLKGPVYTEITFWMKRPKSLPKTALEWHWKRPDKDKLLRAVFDALTHSGIWNDDAQAACSVIKKKYATDDEPVGVSIYIEVLQTND